MLLEYTSLALRSADNTKIIQDSKTLCATLGHVFGIQAHHTISEFELQKLGADNLLTSLHGPLCGKSMLNLATDVTPAFSEWRKTAAYAEKYKVKRVVSHVFYMTDKSVPREIIQRPNRRLAERFFPEKYLIKGSVISSDYVGLEEHRRRLQIVRQNIDRIRKLSPEIELIIENDFPSMGAGMLLAEHLLNVEAPICLDIGHLWVAAHVLERNFIEELDRILGSGNVVMVHLHVNPYPPNTAKTRWKDGHKPLRTSSWMDMPKIIKKIANCRVDHVTFEIYNVTTEDIELFDRWRRQT
jgi:sugar phosphate isomerase/epimerase